MSKQELIEFYTEILEVRLAIAVRDFIEQYSQSLQANNIFPEDMKLLLQVSELLQLKDIK